MSPWWLRISLVARVLLHGVGRHVRRVGDLLDAYDAVVRHRKDSTGFAGQNVKKLTAERKRVKPRFFGRLGKP